MVIDSSAVLAILFDEPDAAMFAKAIREASPRLFSAASLLETSLVVEARKGEEGGRELDLFVYRSGVEIVPVDSEQAEVARIAWRRFGKGNHPAALNYGDLFSYALAKVSGSKLLYKGDDFSRTDLA
jgi:ribonuclease VapC